MTSKQVRMLGTLSALLLGACGEESAAGPVSVCDSHHQAVDDPSVTFDQDIAPLLTKYGCDGKYCHGGRPAASNFEVTSCDALLRPGVQMAASQECAVVRGEPEDSYLIKKLTGAGEIIGNQMPEGSTPMDLVDIETFRQWVREGAPCE